MKVRIELEGHAVLEMEIAVVVTLDVEKSIFTVEPMKDGRLRLTLQKKLLVTESKFFDSPKR